MKLTVFLIIFFLNISGDFCTPMSAIIKEKRDLKTDLISNAQLLLSRAGDVVKHLEKQNRKEEAQLIELEAEVTKQITEKLNAATNETEINELLFGLSNAESYLLKLLERAAQQSFNYEELRLWLIIYGEHILMRANQELEKLRKQNKTNSAELIANDMKLINQSVNNLRNATLIIHVYENEILLSERVKQLWEDLYGLGVGWDLESVRNIQIERANSLLIQTSVVVDKLSNDTQLEERRRDTIIDELEQQIHRITNISEQLKTVTDNQTFAKLEIKLNELELDLVEKLTFLGIETVSKQEKQELLDKIVELYAKVLLQMRKWNDEQKNIEAYVLNHQYVFLRDLEIEVRNSVYPLDFIAFWTRFRGIQSKVSDELKKFGVY